MSLGFSLAAQGFAVGLAYVAPVGSQNLFVVECALGRSICQAWKVALSIAMVDIALAWACAIGMAALMTKIPGAALVLGGAGGLYLMLLGLQIARVTPNADALAGGGSMSWRKALAMTWLNPQAIIDGSLLFGGIQLGRSRAEASVFMLGAALASIAWFVALATVVSGLRSRVSNRLLRGINRGCGLGLVVLGLRLIWTAFRSL